MDLKIDFQRGVPISEQIAHQIRELIETGRLKPGDQLPPARKLAGQLGVNFNTVARAYRRLDQEAIVSAQHGRGTYVLDAQERTGPHNPRQDTIEDLTRFYIRKATYLGFKPDEIRDCFDRYVEEGDPD